jgi:hypothetical protein
MKTFGTIESKDYTVEELPVSAPMSWQLVSGSSGVIITEPSFLEGAITIQRASNDVTDFYDSTTPKINIDTGVYEYLLYRSVKHLFYNPVNAIFYSGSMITTSSITGLPDESYVISIGQQFYGNRIKPGTFELATDIANKNIIDDNDGNLYVNEFGNITYVGNVFYDKGIAVIKHDTGSNVTAISSAGLKLVENSQVYIDYESDVKLYRHEVLVDLSPSEFNFALFNPSILRTYQASGSVSSSAFIDSMQQEGINSVRNSDNTYNLYNLMSNGVIKPYVTSIGLYNEQYELLAVAKLSEPIQRTFDTNQLFIVRFDTE